MNRGQTPTTPVETARPFLTESQRARLAEPGRKIGYLNECHCADGGQGDRDRCSRCYGWMVQE